MAFQNHELPDWDKILRVAFANPLDPTSRDLGTIEPPQSDPFGRSAAEIVAIQQQNSLNYRVVDIEPYILPLSMYATLVSEQDLINVTGPELNSEAGGYGTESNHSPYWRTVPISVQGTFLKVEYLPTRMTDIWQGSFNNGANPRNETVSPVTGGGQNFTAKYAGSQVVLITFDNSDNPPIIAKHGDCFELPFNVAYVTMKVWSPRIRLTIGYNSRITSEGDDRSVATSLAMSPGHGFLNNQYVHPVPFCMTYRDFASGGLAIDTVVLDDIEPMIANPSNAGNANGALYGWITGFSNSFLRSSSSMEGYGTLEILIATYPGLVPLRRLVSLPWRIETSGQGALQMQKQLAEPQRFGVRVGEALCIRLEGAVAGGVSPGLTSRFSVEGYTSGGLVSASQTFPFGPCFKITDEAYPMDINYDGNPSL